MGFLYNKTKVRKSVNATPNFKVGENLPESEVRGGGGPANKGARKSTALGTAQYRQVQPPWGGEFDDQYIGHARPSRAPNLAGIPANNFRYLAEYFGARQ